MENDPIINKLKTYLEIQENQLAEWENILKPGVAKLLRNEAMARNLNITDTDVWRGTDMDTFLHNLKKTYSEDTWIFPERTNSAVFNHYANDIVC